MDFDVPEHTRAPLCESRDTIQGKVSIPSRPEFVRLPKAGGRCPWTGLTRSALNELVLGDRPLVESVVLSRRGAVRGIRLIHFSSLLRFLHQRMSLQMSACPSNGEEAPKDHE